MENLSFISPSNQRILDDIQKREELLQTNPLVFYPWWRPCPVNVLIVADGLDFNPNNDFGLSTFVSILQNDRRSYVKFNITLAHTNLGVTDEQMMKNAIGIVKRIKGFKFDNPSHFSPTMYDQVWLFGVNGAPNSLCTAELRNINLFMNAGGGVFATGDHGSLGRALCSAIPRVRSMRIWDSQNEVSMRGSRRNDTNRRGHNTSWEFDDQSDDVPQEIQPKLYTSRLSFFRRETYPHPILCSHLGRIDVMPDHPHEGECIEPSNLTRNDLLGNAEYPFGVTGQIRPEIIASSSVLANSGDGAGKLFTQAHTFGSICAYDGHQAGVGRVVTDATWHHFVNVNLVGEIGGTTPIKRRGFLASTQGRAAFDKIKEYYINIGVWLSRPHQQTCFNTKLIWPLLTHHRVIEAAVLDPSIRLRDMTLSDFYSVGTHAIDVLGKKASQCRRIQWIIDVVREPLPELIAMIFPWDNPLLKPEEPLPWVDPHPILDAAIGAGIVAVRDEMGDLNQELNDELEEKIRQIFIKGATYGARLGMKDFKQQLATWSTIEVSEEDTYVVKGFIKNEKGELLRDLTVKAVDQDFTEDNPLGQEVEVDDKGFFRITYKASDFIIDGKESGGADIILYIYKDQKLIKTTNPYRNSPKILTVDIVVSS